ncbi:MAG: serine/threonine-protein kinase [Thermoguttaceae bacterium]
MSTPSPSPFEQCALASGLLNQQQLDEARAGVRWSEGDEPGPNAPPTDGQLASRLVDVGLLNAWQAKQLLNGRTKFNLGPYQIIDSIGQGGMGQVFKAKHEKIGRIVAVKVLPHDKSTPEAVANFMREIRALARLDHPRLVAALDAGQDGSVYYLVTEYVPGMDLRKLVRVGGLLGMPAAASIICQVAEGLEYAHSQGLVHRDIKPGNVLVSPRWEVKISDLGLAGPLSGSRESDPRYGKVVGTADYLSPDQLRDPWSPTPAWDIYSLGCTLYYAVTGKVPFPGGTTTDKVRAHCELRPLDPRRLNPNLSSEFVDVMADMLAKESSQRIPSARDVITRLTPFLPDPGDLATSAFAAVPPSPSSPIGATTDRSATSGGLLGPDFIGFPLAMLDEEISASGVLDASQGDGKRPSAMPSREDVAAVLWPLTVFIVAPLLLLGAVLLLWWIAKTFWF